MPPSRSLTFSSLILMSLVALGFSSCGRPSRELSSAAKQEDITQQVETGQPPIAPSPKQDACENAVTQTELNDCAYQNYETVDTQQSQQYQKTFEQLSAPGKADLIAADLAWREFRELDCSFARSQYTGGSTEPLIYYDCLAERSHTRLAELTSTSPEEPSEQRLDATAADAALNQRYQALIALLMSEKTEAIATAQLSWITYRDRNCDFQTNYKDLSRDQCLARMSQTRTTELEDMIEARSL